MPTVLRRRNQACCAGLPVRPSRMMADVKGSSSTGTPCPDLACPNDGLRVDTPHLGATDLAQPVLTLGLEIQGGHVIGTAPAPTGVGDVIEQDVRQTL